MLELLPFIVAGITSGAIYGLAGTGLVLTYKSSGIFNFGHGAIGMSPAVDHVLAVNSDDPRVVKEVHVTMYHVLWELVHVFFEQPGVLAPEVIA